MRKLASKKGFTLLETLLAIAIIAAVALPLLSIFLQSIKTQQIAQGVLSANYISQDYVEKLDATTYEAALNSLPSRTQKSGYYLSAAIEPYGSATALFSGTCDYMQLIFYSDGHVLAVMPDGKWRRLSSIPSSMSFSTSSLSYSFTAGSVSLSGSMDYTYCAVLVNEINKPSGTKCGITLSANCKALRNCKGYNKSDITITGTSETYSDMITGETSMIYVQTYVYDTPTATEPVAVGENYTSIGN